MSALYGFAFDEDPLEFLESVQPKIRRQIRNKIEALAKNPNPPGCKKLQGNGEDEEPIFRIRSGDYRVLYAVRSNPDTIVVLDIGHRKDIYR
jgi:mRNA interferase RelE/StbE